MHGRKSDKMFHAHVVKLEITKDKGKANELLQAEWVLLRVLETSENEFVFLMGFCDYPRSEILGRTKAEISAVRKTA